MADYYELNDLKRADFRLRKSDIIPIHGFFNYGERNLGAAIQRSTKISDKLIFTARCLELTAYHLLVLPSAINLTIKGLEVLIK